jgi:hypothetical protein
MPITAVQMHGPSDAEAATPRTIFSQATASVAVFCDDPTALAHAQATLYSYRQRSCGKAAWTLTVRLTGDLEPLPATQAATVDIGYGLAARAQVERDRSSFVIDALPARVNVDFAARAVVALCRSAEAAMFFTARLIRQMITVQLLEDGAVYAHTAAANIADRGIVIAGNRHRGKTTALIALLRHLPGDYVTNDRLLLRLDASGQISGVPWPVHMHAGIGTLLAYSDLVDLVPEHLRTAPAETLWTLREKVNVEPPNFQRLISNGTVADHCSAELMIWPDVSAQHTTARVERVDPAEVRSTLTATRLFMVDPATGIGSHINHWLIPTPAAEVEDARLTLLAEAIAFSVPCYRVHSGADPADLARAVAELL